MMTVEQFWQTVDRSLAAGTLRRATLSKFVARTTAHPPKIVVRSILLKDETWYQLASRWPDHETHENLSAAETLDRLRVLIGTVYEDIHIGTNDAEMELHDRGDARPRVKHRSRPSTAPPVAHNREKLYLIPENVPCAFLEQIGVMNRDGRVRAAMQAKFRQINRFLELVEDVLPALPPTGNLRVIDFGCGKSYLTFALHHLLTVIHGRSVEIVGFDRKSDVVADCQALAVALQCAGLEFRQGEIAGQSIEGEIDLAVSLHACDTATDDTLATSVSARAAVILAVPCCQHELAGAIRVERLEPVDRHGILHERASAVFTDALRAQALEACGYKTQVLEFIDMEHTAKNLLIRAVRRADRFDPRDATVRYADFKRTLGIESCAADRILAARSQAAPAIPQAAAP